MADIEITHTRAEGTLLKGSRKGDGIFEIVRNHGFWFSRSLPSLYIRHSRDREADSWRINAAAAALRAAGHEVTVKIKEEVRRTFAEAEADREARAEDRAERFDNRAGRAAAESESRHGAARGIMRHIPFGQPILVGHHSQRRAERDAERIDSNMRRSIDEHRKAGYWAGRAQSAEQYAEHRNNPQVTLRRLERLGADLRQQERYRDQAVAAGRDPGRHARQIEDLAEEIAYWQKLIKEAEESGVKIWGPDDFAPRDYVLSRSSWYQVARVNPKTLSIAWNLRRATKKVMSLEDATEPGYKTGTFTTDYTQVRARCPEAAMLAFLAEGKVPGTKSAAEASAAQPASAVREALAAKPKPKKRTSDPKVPKRVKVECRWGAGEARLTWLNGRSQPHKDHEPVTILAPEGVKFTESVWSASLLAQVAALLTERGYSFRSSGWSGGPGSGIVRAIEEAGAPEAGGAEDERPAAEETPAADEAPAPGDEGQAPGEGEAPGAEEPPAAPEGTEHCEKESAPDQGISSGKPVPPRLTAVRFSVYPLNSTPPEEPAVTEQQTEAPRLNRRDRRVATIADMCGLAGPDVERTAELDAAYRRYVDDGIAATDGWYAPLDFQAWAHILGAPDAAAATAGDAGEAPEGAEHCENESASDQGFSSETPELEASPAVRISVYPLNEASSEESKMTDTTAPAAPAVETSAPAEKAAPKRAPRAKKAAAAIPAPVKRRVTKPAPAAAPVEKAPRERKTVQKSIPTDRIINDPNQPREIFDEAKLEELAKSMKRLGQLQPITVRYAPGTKLYILVSGERRWRAAKSIGLTEMTALVLHGVEEGERETLAKSTAENVGRADMTPIEEAKAFQRLADAEYTIDEIAEMCGKSASYIGWRIDLLRLCDAARDALAKGHMTVGLAWYVSLLNANNQMRFLARHARGEFKSVREAEAFAQAARAEEKRQEQQGSFFVLAEESASGTDVQDALPGSIDVPVEERERIVDERSKLTKKIDRLGDAGALLAELATADPEELALLLAGTPGGVAGHLLRIEHLREVAQRAQRTLRQAQAIAAVRANSIRINPDAAAPETADVA
ncbi:ParB/RepB/Spo0J family partition protein [Streptomyces sp. NPDC001552]|uniref:ParB/RepB/Spo0J family partition protein n=1 Tax=Streptomyces sp. NPDC001552 TaxID=3364587 RepID=UPI00369029D2